MGLLGTLLATNRLQETAPRSLSYKMPFLLSFLDHVDPRDLGEVSLNYALLARMSHADWDRVRAQMRADLEDYHVRV